MVYSYNGYYVRLSTGRQGFNSPIHRQILFYNKSSCRPIGRALALGARRCRFESCRLDHRCIGVTEAYLTVSQKAGVQLPYTPPAYFVIIGAWESGIPLRSGRSNAVFDSRSPDQMPHWCIGSISRRQRDETGSIPVCGSILLYGVKVAQRPLAPLVFVRVEIEQPYCSRKARS